MRKYLLTVVLIISLLLLGCGNDEYVSNGVDIKIRSLIAEIPIPDRYNTETGELLLSYEIGVKRVPYWGDEYDETTGEKIKARYRVILKWDNGDELYLTQVEYWPYQQHTLDTIRNLKDKLYWE